jgi:colanic acid/amylovoran biosynthesis protein
VSIAKKQKYKIFNVSEVLLKAFKYFLWSKLKIPVNQREKEILKAYSNANIILSCGGGFLGGHHLAIRHVYSIYFGKLLKKPVVIWAQSIEPFGNIATSIFTKFVLNRVDLITTREKLSFEYLKSLNIKPDIRLTADAAFLVDYISDEEAIKLLEKGGIKKDKLVIGMTVKKWNFPGHKNADKKFLNYLNVISKTIEYIISSMDARVILFPQVICTSYDDDDRTVSHLIKSKLNDSIKERVIVLTDDYRVEELKGMIGQMDLFIGTRMHSNIFATSMNVPTLAISYQQKTDGVMEMLGLEEYVIDINTINTQELISKIEKIWAERADIKKKLETNIRVMQDKNMDNVRLVLKYLGLHESPDEEHLEERWQNIRD